VQKFTDYCQNDDREDNQALSASVFTSLRSVSLFEDEGPDAPKEKSHVDEVFLRLLVGSIFVVVRFQLGSAEEDSADVVFEPFSNADQNCETINSS